jgi:hypothetical protein
VKGRPALLLLLVLAACRREASRSAPPADSGSTSVAVDPQTVTGRVALELWPLRTGVSLAEWSGSNLNDMVAGSDSEPIADYFGSWCAVASRTFVVQGRTIVRRAFFYPPAPPEGLILADSMSPTLLRDCTLGLIWITIPIGDSAAAVAVNDSVHAQLARAYRPDQATVTFFGSAYWSGARRLRQGAVQLVTALRSPPSVRAPGDTTSGRDVVTLAMLPSSGVSLDSGPAAETPYAPPDTIPLDSAVRLSGLDSALALPLLRAARGPTSDTPARAMDQPADSLIRPLRRWIEAAARLAPPRRAAAIYLADHVLARAACSYHLCEPGDSVAQRPLRALGATFVFSELGGGWSYQRSWLEQARTLDRDGRLGELILLEQLRGGFDFSGTCRGGAEMFRTVIQNGERYLERLPQSRIAGDVHFYVGEGYRDIVALAAGAGQEYVDSTQYRDAAPEARRRAISHYRAALASDRTSPTAAAAWSRAWWLLAGLRPRTARFYCVYD